MSAQLCPLDQAELALLNHVWDGHTQREIADDLHISTRTVRNRLQDIRSTLGVDTTHDALRLMIREGWLK